jgi:hypothetical protein
MYFCCPKFWGKYDRNRRNKLIRESIFQSLLRLLILRQWPIIFAILALLTIQMQYRTAHLTWKKRHVFYPGRSNDCRSIECRSNDCQSIECRSNDIIPNKQRHSNNIQIKWKQIQICHLLFTKYWKISLILALLTIQMQYGTAHLTWKKRHGFYPGVGSFFRMQRYYF